MKRFLIFPCVLCLIIGLLTGILLPIDLREDSIPPTLGSTPGNLTAPSDLLPSESSGSTSSAAAPLEHPRIIAPRIVAPDRDVPGTSDKIWKRPI